MSCMYTEIHTGIVYVIKIIHQHSVQNFSFYAADGGGIQGLAPAGRNHGEHFHFEETMVGILCSRHFAWLAFCILKYYHGRHQATGMVGIRNIIMTQGVTLMKQTGLLCFADEPQNPFVTSVLASFQQVIIYNHA